jgi:hypothetical protein
VNVNPHVLRRAWYHCDLEANYAYKSVGLQYFTSVRKMPSPCEQQFRKGPVASGTDPKFNVLVDTLD